MSGPYRGSSHAANRCAACGEALSPDARVCARCGAERPAVRCGRCMTLNAVGSELCASCGALLDLEPEPVPTQLLCPRGCGPLGAITIATSGGASDVAECERCGGLFVDNSTLMALVAEHRPVTNPDGTPAVAPSIPRPRLPAEGEVRYVPCPSCNVRMNRTVFGKSSGVVVDVCRTHGTWFDARELTASLAFVERGGLERVERREKLRREEQARAASVERRTRDLEALNRPMPGFAGRFDPDAMARAEAVRDILDILLGL